MFMHFGRGLVRNAIAPSSARTYEGYFGSWVQFRREINRGVFLSCQDDAIHNVWSLIEYIGFAYARKGLRSNAVASHLAAVAYFHRVERAVDLDIHHSLIKNALMGLKRSHAVVGSQQRVRRPVSLSMLMDGEHLSVSWGIGGRVLWMGLCASFFFLTRSPEMFADSVQSYHPLYCLRRSDVAFFRGHKQLCRPDWCEADRVEVRFRASKGDQLRLGVVVTRVRVGPALAFRDGGGAVALMTELMSVSDSYPPDAPIMTYGVRDSGSLLVWNRYDAVAALRQVVALAGLPPAEFALHSFANWWRHPLVGGRSVPRGVAKGG